MNNEKLPQMLKLWVQESQDLPLKKDNNLLEYAIFIAIIKLSQQVDIFTIIEQWRTLSTRLILV